MQVIVVSSGSAAGLVTALRQSDVRAQHSATLSEAAEVADLYRFDLAMVESVFAGGGRCAIRGLRTSHKRLPIMVFGQALDRPSTLDCFSSGADDIVDWPGEPEIIAARIRAIVRRCRVADTGVLQIGLLRFDMINRSLHVAGLPVILTGKEYGVLEYMMTRRSVVLSKTALLDQLYGTRDAPDARIIDVFVCKLRRKLADHGVHGLIETVRGQGYVLSEHSCRFTPPAPVLVAADGAVVRAPRPSCLVAPP